MQNEFAVSVMRLKAVQTLLIGMLTLIVSSSLVFASSLNDAISAFSHGDYSKARRLLKPLAQEGIPEAQFALGVIYREGKGVAKSLEEAADLFCSAATKKLPDAEYNCGLMNALGEGIAQNIRKQPSGGNYLRLKTIHAHSLILPFCMNKEMGSIKIQRRQPNGFKK
jgi:hypothetical protein